MRAIDIVATTIGNSFRSRLRTTLTVIAIFIGAFTLTITNGLGTGINDYIDSQVASIGAPDVMTVTKPVEARDDTEGPAPYQEGGASEIPSNTGAPGATVLALTDADLDRIAEVDGIESVEPRVAVRPDYIQAANGDKFVLTVSPLGDGARIELAAGALFDDAPDDRQIIVPTTYVESLGFDSNDDVIGAPVTIGVTNALREQSTIEATIVGVQEPTLLGANPSLNEALRSAIVDAQNVGAPVDTVSEYASATARFDPDSTDAQIAAIKAALVDAGYSGTTVADQIGTFQSVIDGIILVLNAFAVIALLAAGFGIINTLLMSVQERTREIGLMKAMGMSGPRIFALFSTEAVFIGFLGSAIGAGVAMLVGGVISGVLARGLLQDLAGLQLLAFSPAAIASVLLLVMGIAFLAAVLPASRAARQSPIDSLRYE
ncbi:ABC transporter permease [Leifsonia sp. H3M29-4]|uniref:ABC transporter permease n=1 Tax=Salinibacterium metalliresistens TaxID=3031321 RepID=UPI0023DB9481|nr:ABC transporter permease [Salinibacterium metalliresistens]MDF1480185.1 ABC transporter permease [Salinibacterium metalliresistens]